MVHNPHTVLVAFQPGSSAERHKHVTRKSNPRNPGLAEESTSSKVTELEMK